MARRLTTRLVKLKDACAALAISDDTFARHWQSVFTETRARGPEKGRAPQGA